jgi:L-amino acid N-acyltransferase YncA
MSSIIRIASEDDLPAIVDIYNQAIALRSVTADLTPVSVESRKIWLREHTPVKYPVFVAENKSVVTGWCSLSPYRPGRLALRHTAEISFFIHEDFRKKGVGTSLVAHTIRHCPHLEIKTIFAIVLDINTASVGFLNKFGFEQWGHMPNVADFDGRECGHLYYGLRVPS